MWRLSSSVAVGVCRRISTAAPREAPPALLVTLAKPLARVVAVVVGKGIRSWWSKLPGDRRVLVKDVLRKHRKKFLGLGLMSSGGAALAYESHLQECQVTGRKRFVALTPDQMKKISRLEFEGLLDSFKSDIVPQRDPVYTRVSKVANRLLAGNRDLRAIYDKTWTVTVVDQPTKNAFVLPSGNIFVFRGMLDMVENDDQLGVILGHEMAHTVLGHVAEKLTTASFLQLLLLLPLAVLWAALPNDGVALIANWFIDKVVEVLVDLPFSRNMEIEADEVGLMMASKACFDVREAPVLWARLELLSTDPLETDKDLEFISTHPCHATRQQNLQQQLEQALRMRSDCGCFKLDPRRDPRVRLLEFQRYLEKQNANSFITSR